MLTWKVRIGWRTSCPNHCYRVRALGSGFLAPLHHSERAKADKFCAVVWLHVYVQNVHFQLFAKLGFLRRSVLAFSSHQQYQAIWCHQQASRDLKVWSDELTYSLLFCCVRLALLWLNAEYLDLHWSLAL